MLELIRVMGRLGIEVWCYNWMAVVSWSRTSAVRDPRRRDATASTRRRGPTSRIHRSAGHGGAPLGDPRVVPRARGAGRRGGRRRLALHPDDPPLSPLRGIGRIIRSLDAYDRVFELQPSPANGMTFCQGNVTLMTDDLPAAIRRFGEAGRIHFVHFRDVRGTPERFVETFVDDGPTDMAACIRAYVDAGSTPRSAPTTRRRSRATAGSCRAIRPSPGSTPSATCRG